jgi:hypothetical protein
MGYGTEASGDYSTAMGLNTQATQWWSTAIGTSSKATGWVSTAMGEGTEASGQVSTTMGRNTIASGYFSTAMGFYTTAGSASYATAIGRYCTNNVQESFAVGFGTDNENRKVDFRVESDKVTVGDVSTKTGDLDVGRFVDANDYLEHSSFYDKSVYGKALDYVQDSSNTTRLNADGQKEYNHEADPAFLTKSVTLKDYERYTEEEVWDETLEQNITVRKYETYEEPRSSLGMKVAWLRQCVYELKQENEMLKADLAELKAAVGVQ